MVKLTFKEWLEAEYPDIEKFYHRKKDMQFATNYSRLEEIFNYIKKSIEDNDHPGYCQYKKTYANDGETVWKTECRSEFENRFCWHYCPGCGKRIKG